LRTTRRIEGSPSAGVIAGKRNHAAGLRDIKELRVDFRHRRTDRDDHIAVQDECQQGTADAGRIAAMQNHALALLNLPIRKPVAPCVYRVEQFLVAVLSLVPDQGGLAGKLAEPFQQPVRHRLQSFTAVSETAFYIQSGHFQS
jgi:hypothetical protein